jgi:sirohydrochlorin ferrochelatase
MNRDPEISASVLVSADLAKALSEDDAVMEWFRRRVADELWRKVNEDMERLLLNGTGDSHG